MEVGEAVSNLQAGVYIAEAIPDRTSMSVEVRLVSLETGSPTRLLTIRDLINPREVYLAAEGARILSGFEYLAERSIIELPIGEGTQFVVCAESPLSPSPSGLWLATLCVEQGVIQQGDNILQLVSLLDGTGYELQIASNERRRVSPTDIYWLDDSNFVAHLGPQESPCLVDTGQPELTCPEALVGKELASASPDAKWVMVYRRDRIDADAWGVREIYPLECFHDETRCQRPLIVDERFVPATNVFWSGDGKHLAIDSGDPRTSTTAEIGYYDVDTWTYHFLRQTPRQEGILGWCPDSSCLIMAGDSLYRLFLDGRIEPSPAVVSYVIDIIEIP